MLTVSHAVLAGGIGLGATRVIYPAGATQTSLTVNNSDDKSRFLIQSWVEDSSGNKTSDFIVTPPLFVANPKGENTLRIMYTGKPLPTDRESIFWMNVKAIPSVNKNELQDKNVLQLAVLSRIKLFVRPANLAISSTDAPGQLHFSRVNETARIDNPTPYYITLVNINRSGKKLPNVMVPPMGYISIPLPAGTSGDLTYQTINDYGGNTPKASGVLK
ncbi:fimbria/pilus periplasmic chaperone [Brenneria populi]|uniref:Fimbria/pilus periplasmic chaperone n=1 Tax=Brenneria populi TaxID=1505588 RepID=A0ABU6JNC5_9GAMM|nr:fimbria/pilus periplasmic chaperone [Brenneria populi Li et al. 2015]